jgi:hypothetical protein
MDPTAVEVVGEATTLKKAWENFDSLTASK